MFETRDDPDTRADQAGTAALPEAFAGLSGALARLGDLDPEELGAEAVTAGVTRLQAAESSLAGLVARWVQAAMATGAARSSGAANATQWLVDTGGGSTRKARRTAGRATG